MDRDQAEARLAERTRLRLARDFTAADRIRDELREGGWEVVDGPQGSELRAFEPPPRRRDATLLTLVHGWVEDAERWLAGVLRHSSGDYEPLLVDSSASAEVGQRLDELAADRARVFHVEHPFGWAEAANAGLEAAAGDVVVLFDPGVEVAGDVVGPLTAALADATVAVAGPFGVRAEEGLKEFAADAGPEVDAIEGYCMAFRRADALAAGGFDRRFRFYRIADFDLSFRLRAAAGGRALVVDVPVIKHAHRLWEAEPPAERERLSRRNYYRFLDRWRDRQDLVTAAPRPPH